MTGTFGRLRNLMEIVVDILVFIKVTFKVGYVYVNTGAYIGVEDEVFGAVDGPRSDEVIEAFHARDVFVAIVAVRVREVSNLYAVVLRLALVGGDVGAAVQLVVEDEAVWALEVDVHEVPGGSSDETHGVAYAAVVLVVRKFSL